MGTVLFEAAAKFTRIVEYGVSAKAVFRGQAPPPPEGLRLDIRFEGSVRGRVHGTVRGVDLSTGEIRVRGVEGHGESAI